MRVESSKKGRRTAGPVGASAPVLFEAGTGVGAYGRLGALGPVAGGEDIVRARLSRLLATLGELSSRTPLGAARLAPGLTALPGRALPARDAGGTRAQVAQPPLGYRAPDSCAPGTGGGQPELRPGAARWLPSSPGPGLAGHRNAGRPQGLGGRGHGAGRGPPAGPGARHAAPLLCLEVVAGRRAVGRCARAGGGVRVPGGPGLGSSLVDAGRGCWAPPTSSPGG